MQEKTRALEKATAKRQISKLWDYLNQWSVNPSPGRDHFPPPSHALSDSPTANTIQKNQNSRQEKLWRYLSPRSNDTPTHPPTEDKQTRQRLTISELIAKDKTRSTFYSPPSSPPPLSSPKATQHEKWIKRAKRRLSAMSSELLDTSNDLSTQYFDDASNHSFSLTDPCEPERAYLHIRTNQSRWNVVSDAQTESD